MGRGLSTSFTIRLPVIIAAAGESAPAQQSARTNPLFKELDAIPAFGVI